MEAHPRRAPLQIVHAAPYALGNPVDERRAESILALAHTVAAHAQPDVPTYTECVFERPARVLIGAAEAARLLVIGMGGGSGFDDVPVPSLALDVWGDTGARWWSYGEWKGRYRPTGRWCSGWTTSAATWARSPPRSPTPTAPRRGSVVVHALRGPDAVLDAIAGHPADARAWRRRRS